MPVNPSVWRSGFPITAHQLNQDLYTYDGTYFGANGVMFHSNRALMYESYGKFGTSLNLTKGGSFYQLAGPAGTGISILDNAGLYGTGSDAPGNKARFVSSGAVAPGSAGGPGLLGGWQLMVNFINVNTIGSTNSTIGACWFQQGNVLLDIGAMQPGNTFWGNTAFAVDLIQRNPTSPNQIYSPGIFLQDSVSGNTIVGGSSVGTTGNVSRFIEIWMGVCNGFGSTVSSIPNPVTSIGGATTLSSSTLNTTIQQTFNLLNNPPMLNVQMQNTSAITANVVTTAPFTATPLTDNYSKFNVSTETYTVPLPGLYFCHANIIYSTGWNAGSGIVGFQVNGTNYWSGSGNATPSGAQNTGISSTKILDLNAGDTVKVVTQTSTNSNFGTANVSHFIMSWLCPIDTSTQTWIPPDVTGFQFLAGTAPGTAPTQLAGIMNTKIANDINFLLHRPYLTVHQSTAQTGLTASNSAGTTVLSPTMQSTVGLVHGSLGDNYGGWSVANNNYVAQVPGWYLAVAEVNSATSATANLQNALIAGFQVPTSGGVTAPTGYGGPPDFYQRITTAYSWTYPSGACAIGLYYLQPGESIKPTVTFFSSATTTFSTDVTHGFLSHFNLLWLSN